MRKQFVIMGLVAVAIGLLMNYAPHIHENTISDLHTLGGIVTFAGVISAIFGVISLRHYKIK